MIESRTPTVCERSDSKTLSDMSAKDLDSSCKSRFLAVSQPWSKVLSSSTSRGVSSIMIPVWPPAKCVQRDDYWKGCETLTCYRFPTTCLIPLCSALSDVYPPWLLAARFYSKSSGCSMRLRADWGYFMALFEILNRGTFAGVSLGVTHSLLWMVRSVPWSSSAN